MFLSPIPPHRWYWGFKLTARPMSALSLEKSLRKIPNLGFLVFCMDCFSCLFFLGFDLSGWMVTQLQPFLVALSFHAYCGLLFVSRAAETLEDPKVMSLFQNGALFSTLVDCCWAQRPEDPPRLGKIFVFLREILLVVRSSRFIPPPP